jgi:hypothetical protein
VWSGGPITPNPGDTKFEFAVQYIDDDQVNPDSLDDADIIVLGPNGYRQRAKYQNFGRAPTPDRHVGGWYSIPAPGGAWDPADNGQYQVLVRRRNVYDNKGHAVRAGQIGVFQVKFDNSTTNALSRSIPAHPQEHEDVISSKRKDTQSIFLC